MRVARRAFLAVAGASMLWAASAPKTPAAAVQTVAATQAGAPAPMAPGRHRLRLVEHGPDGLLYVPQDYRPGVPAPLMVLLHGFNGSAESAASTFPLADEFGVLVLAPESREITWDVILDGFGPDVEFIQAALAQVFACCAVDRQHLALAGLSDGASYALSLGIGNGDFFTHLIALAPGVMTPADARGSPRIFISHGTNDTVMPIDDTSRKIVTRLETLGYDVTYREFEGGHRAPPTILRDAFEWFVR